MRIHLKASARVMALWEAYEAELRGRNPAYEAKMQARLL
jgi:hypothetical protein